MTYIVIALVLSFAAGFFTGKGGRLYVYLDSELHRDNALDKYHLWLGELGALGVELFGIDYTDGVLSPVYRPTVRFIRDGRVLLIGLRVGDFDEANVLLSPRWPFIKPRYERNIHSRARSLDE